VIAVSMCAAFANGEIDLLALEPPSDILRPTITVNPSDSVAVSNFEAKVLDSKTLQCRFDIKHISRNTNSITCCFVVEFLDKDGFTLASNTSVETGLKAGHCKKIVWDIPFISSRAENLASCRITPSVTIYAAPTGSSDIELWSDKLEYKLLEFDDNKVDWRIPAKTEEAQADVSTEKETVKKPATHKPTSIINDTWNKAQYDEFNKTLPPIGDSEASGQDKPDGYSDFLKTLPPVEPNIPAESTTPTQAVPYSDFLKTLPPLENKPQAATVNTNKSLSDDEFNKTLPPLAPAITPVGQRVSPLQMKDSLLVWFLTVLLGSGVVFLVWKGIRLMEKWSAAQKQKMVICVALVLIVLAGLFPPWIIENYRARGGENIGMHFVLIPPERGSINTGILFVEWLLIAIPAAGLWFMFKDKGEGAK